MLVGKRVGYFHPLVISQAARGNKSSAFIVPGEATTFKGTPGQLIVWPWTAVTSSLHHCTCAHHCTSSLQCTCAHHCTRSLYCTCAHHYMCALHCTRSHQCTCAHHCMFAHHCTLSLQCTCAHYSMCDWTGASTTRCKVTCGVIVDTARGVNYQRGSTKVWKRHTFEMCIEYGRPSWQQAQYPEVAADCTRAWMLPARSHMPNCRRGPNISLPIRQNSPPTAPIWVIFIQKWCSFDK